MRLRRKHIMHHLNRGNINWKGGMLSVLLVLASACSEEGSSGNGDIWDEADTDSQTGQTDTDVDTGTDTDEAVDGDIALPGFEWEVDPSIQPFAEALHGFTPESPPRPLSAVGGADMPTATFVQNELVIFSDDSDAVARFVARVGGDLILSEDPVASGVETPMMHLVAVNEPAVDMADMAEDMTRLARRALIDDGEHGDATSDDGEHGDSTLRFSDMLGARLVALAAREAAVEGLVVAINWVSQPSAIPYYTEEAHNGTSGFRDAYDFDWFKRDTGMRTGVTDAWNLLHHGGRLDNTVKIAILDMGFKVTSDLENVTATTVWPGFGPLNRENDYDCTGGSECPWHGTDVAGAAMGIEDNQFGSAGPAGPVGEPVLVYTTYDYLASITAVYRARSKGAKIINMSYGVPVPWWLKWTVAGFRHATSAIRDSGVLLFAAAGNEHRNVDSEICFLGYCWEKTFYTPCENGGVTCVGGLSGPHSIDPSSNYGDENVDLYGPWCVSVGPNPEDNDFHTSCGTSISSPFVAGVAALVWAANPSLSAADVAGILADTADGYREEKVNAYEAVLTAIGTLSDVTIVDPNPGSEIIFGIPSPLSADLTFVSKPGPPIDAVLTWYSSLDGELGSREVTVERETGDVHSERVYLDAGLSEGLHQITVIAEIERPGDIWNLFPPIIRQDTSNVLVTNPGPSVVIETPSAGETFCQGESIVFRAVGSDVNQTLPQSAYAWTSIVDATPFPIAYLLGDGPVMTTDLLPAGEQTVSVTITDNGGESAADSVDIEIIPISDPACSNLPPQIAITAPVSGAVIMATGYDENGTYADIALQATVTDYEDDDATLQVEWYSDTDGLIATGADTTGRVYMTDVCDSSHIITAHVVDSDANEDQDAVSIHIYIVC
ncbi:MAG: S8 family serine peptidase [Myxococcota bacterium]|nr:S8 family serine peptidase [Myxococcota bacterium]